MELGFLVHALAGAFDSALFRSHPYNLQCETFSIATNGKFTVATNTAQMTVGDATWDKYIGYPIGILAIVGAMFASSLIGLILRYVESSDDWQILLLGIGPLAGQYILISVGARWVPAAEISLLTFIEILLAPVWVWIFFDKVPSDYTVVGGVLIVGAVLSHTFLGATEVR